MEEYQSITPNILVPSKWPIETLRNVVMELVMMAIELPMGSKDRCQHPRSFSSYHWNRDQAEIYFYKDWRNVSLACLHLWKNLPLFSKHLVWLFILCLQKSWSHVHDWIGSTTKHYLITQLRFNNSRHIATLIFKK